MESDDKNCLEEIFSMTEYVHASFYNTRKKTKQEDIRAG